MGTLSKKLPCFPSVEGPFSPVECTNIEGIQRRENLPLQRGKIFNLYPRWLCLSWGRQSHVLQPAPCLNLTSLGAKFYLCARGWFRLCGGDGLPVGRPVASRLSRFGLSYLECSCICSSRIYAGFNTLQCSVELHSEYYNLSTMPLLRTLSSGKLNWYIAKLQCVQN